MLTWDNDITHQSNRKLSNTALIGFAFDLSAIFSTFGQAKINTIATIEYIIIIKYDE